MFLHGHARLAETWHNAGVKMSIADILAVMADSPTVNIDTMGRDCERHATLAHLKGISGNINDEAIAHHKLDDVAGGVIKRRAATRYVGRPMTRMLQPQNNGEVRIVRRWQQKTLRPRRR